MFDMIVLNSSKFSADNFYYGSSHENVTSSDRFGRFNTLADFGCSFAEVLVMQFGEVARHLIDLLQTKS